MDQSPHLRLGTRGSLLAIRQSGWVAVRLASIFTGLRIETVVIKTTGDRITHQPLHELGGKGLFVKEIEQALLDHEIDFAVHSYKDVPVTMPLIDVSKLVIAATPTREDPRDVLVALNGKSIADLPNRARVGTGSLRRRCQLLALRPDLSIESVRGNIDTRLHKVGDGEFDAVILARAGLLRAGLFDSKTMQTIPTEQILPAGGQGALALQCRGNDTQCLQYLSALNDPATATCVAAERALVAALKGDCHSPIAALAEVDKENLLFRAVVGAADGNLPVIRAAGTSLSSRWQHAVDEVCNQLINQGVRALLHGSR